MIAIPLLFIGLAGLWLGAELTIKGALAIAERYKLSQVFVGLAIVAFGTDLPELFVIVAAAIDRLNGIETSAIVIGEAIGTSLSQIALMMGIAAVAGPLIISKRVIFRDGVTMIGSVVLLFLLGIDGELSRIDGILMTFLYGGYFVQLVREERKKKRKATRPQDFNLLWSVLSLIGGFIVLAFMSDLTIDNAITLSELFNIDKSIVGIFIVGLGTSLPELATALSAVRRKAGTVAATTFIGGNIYDLLLAVGAGTVISGFLVDTAFLRFDLPVLFIVSVVAMFLFRSNYRIQKREGFILIGLYAAYAVTKLWMTLGAG